MKLSDTVLADHICVIVALEFVILTGGATDWIVYYSVVGCHATAKT